MNETIDIYSKAEYPANVLSNFYANAFTFDGVNCASMEGFLQSLKVRSQKTQRKICSLVGIKAKEKGTKRFLWKLTGNVYWQGKKYIRESEDFTRLICRAYDSLFEQNAEFRAALLSAKDKKLIHSIGKNDPKKTILTEQEFINCLNNLLKKNDLS